MQHIRYTGNYITVTEETIHNHVFERVVLRPGVQVIPYRDDGKILLMHESRLHETTSRWKLVAGWIDKDGTTPLQHAIDELAEEVGYTATSWTHLLKMDDTNFTVSYQTDFFVCTDLVKIPNPPNNPDEGCQVFGCEWFSFDEIFDLMTEGRILKDNTILVALCYIREQLKNKKV